MNGPEIYSYPPAKLTENEEKMPCARFIRDYPLHKPSPIYQQVLDQGPMDPEDAIRAEDWLSLLDIVEKGYRKVMYGYCMMPDGSAFYIEYSVAPATWQGKWRRWFGQWYNCYSRSTDPKEGNIRYKIWNPIDHWDHQFINGKDDSDGIRSLETLDIGKTGDPSKGIPQISRRVNLREHGLTAEREEELAEKDVRIEGFWEEFPGHPGHHLVLRLSRPCPMGGRESVNCEWLGWYPENGQILRDESTPCSEEIVRDILIHNTIERQHLYEVLPDLYEAYKDKDPYDD